MAKKKKEKRTNNDIQNIHIKLKMFTILCYLLMENIVYDKNKFAPLVKISY